MFTTTKSPNFRPFKIVGNISNDRAGGWVVGELTLKKFFEDWKLQRNLWSKTNCGFDLARYRGTWMTLYPAEEVDYIFWWDTDYGNTGEFKTLVSNIHPAILINRPNTTVVLSRRTTGRYKPKTVYIPSPTVFGNKWRQMSEWANSGLAVFAITIIDLRYPWIHPGWEIDGKVPYPMYDYAKSTGTGLKEVLSINDKWNLAETWWNKSDSGSQPATTWKTNWPSWTAQTMTPLDKSVYPAVALGPFVVKDQRTQAQITLTYRSSWQWGGDILTIDEKVCDPTTGVPPSYKALSWEEPQDPGAYITKRDLDKSGFIHPDVWRRLTAEPAKTAGITPMHRIAEGEVQTEEETSESTLQNEDSEEEENQMPKRPRISRGRLDGRRLRNLERLRFLVHKLKELRRHSI